MGDAPGEVKVELNAQELWSRYEEIAMHFNELLMRLRLQSLAGIAAVSTLVGLFSKEGIADVQVSWLVATGIFLAMSLFGWRSGVLISCITTAC